MVQMAAAKRLGSMLKVYMAGVVSAWLTLSSHWSSAVLPTMGVQVQAPRSEGEAPSFSVPSRMA